MDWNLFPVFICSYSAQPIYSMWREMIVHATTSSLQCRLVVMSCRLICLNRVNEVLSESFNVTKFLLKKAKHRERIGRPTDRGKRQRRFSVFNSRFFFNMFSMFSTIRRCFTLVSLSLLLFAELFLFPTELSKRKKEDKMWKASMQKKSLKTFTS